MGCIEPWVENCDTNRIVSWCIVTALVNIDAQSRIMLLRSTTCACAFLTKWVILWYLYWYFVDTKSKNSTVHLYVNVVSISSTCSSVAQLSRRSRVYIQITAITHVLIQSIVNHLLFHCCSQFIYVLIFGCILVTLQIPHTFDIPNPVCTWIYIKTLKPISAYATPYKSPAVDRAINPYLR